jgi:hypothetical protein
MGERDHSQVCVRLGILRIERQDSLELLHRGILIVCLEVLGRLAKMIVNLRGVGDSGLCGQCCKGAHKQGENHGHGGRRAKGKSGIMKLTA